MASGNSGADFSDKARSVAQSHVIEITQRFRTTRDRALATSPTCIPAAEPIGERSVTSGSGGWQLCGSGGYASLRFFQRGRRRLRRPSTRGFRTVLPAPWFGFTSPDIRRRPL